MATQQETMEQALAKQHIHVLSGADHEPAAWQKPRQTEEVKECPSSSAADAGQGGAEEERLVTVGELDDKY